jgi:isopenicillin N synthase-like dioxygenase
MLNSASDRATIPTIDVGALRSGSRAELDMLAAEIGAVAREIGFFSVVNHGISDDVVQAAFEASRAFFALPLAVKEHVAVERSPIYRGYARNGLEQFDEAFPPDAKESFDIGPDLAADDPAVVAREPFRDVNLWPDVATLPGFRRTITAYFDAVLALTIDLHRPIAVDLGLDEDYFTRRYDRPLPVLRLLHYPPLPGRFDGALHGAAPHTDYGNLTLLAQDNVGGLEVRQRNGDWIRVEPNPAAFVCNIGDCLMRWSNDVYASTLHRVINATGRERYSIAFFGDPNPNALVSPVPSCVTVDRPAKYPPIDYLDYLKMRLAGAYPTIEAT